MIKLRYTHFCTFLLDLYLCIMFFLLHASPLCFGNKLRILYNSLSTLHFISFIFPCSHYSILLFLCGFGFRTFLWYSFFWHSINTYTSCWNLSLNFYFFVHFVLSTALHRNFIFLLWFYLLSFCRRPAFFTI